MRKLISRRIVRKRKKATSEIIYKTRGKVKQVTGKVLGNDKLKSEGKGDELENTVKGAVDYIKH
jgi:uncharacterized protein YjbJ (UPF0337 family)